MKVYLLWTLLEVLWAGTLLCGQSLNHFHELQILIGFLLSSKIYLYIKHYTFSTIR
jgi:hypothetical protein